MGWTETPDLLESPESPVLKALAASQEMMVRTETPALPAPPVSRGLLVPKVPWVRQEMMGKMEVPESLESQESPGLRVCVAHPEMTGKMEAPDFPASREPLVLKDREVLQEKMEWTASFSVSPVCHPWRVG